MSDEIDVEDHRIIPANLAITAMRDSGYKNTAYAIAELIDNAQQAGARTIEVLCIQKTEMFRKRSVSRLDRIAVLDDGSGMDKATLWQSLQFGNGTRLEDRSGIGRFGMGLPNASISQAGRVDVWSWQNGPDNALHTYLSVRDMEQSVLEDIPEPQHAPLPQEWKDIGQSIGETGTLVVWSELDMGRMTWKKGESTLRNTGLLAGRIYRRFLDDGSLTIRLFSSDWDRDDLTHDRECKLIDPMYLQPVASLPAPFDTEPMFESVHEESISIVLDNRTHEVVVRWSRARDLTVEAADGRDRGTTDYGKHAARNTGVSLMRANRELMLDRNWCLGYDTRERWWGCEVEFPPALDEIFGVTNNKQHAVHFAQLAALDWTDLAETNEDLPDVADRLQAEGDPRGYLLTLSNLIKRELKELRKDIKHQNQNTRTSPLGTRHSTDDDPATTRANEAWTDRGEEAPFENEDEVPDEDEAQEIESDLVEDKGLSEEEAARLVAAVKNGELKVVFVEAAFPDDRSLFNVEPRKGVTEIVFNRNHPVFDKIFGIVNMADENIEDLTTDDLIERLGNAVMASKLIFAAWGRLELEASARRREIIKDVRFDWGHMAQRFVKAS